MLESIPSEIYLEIFDYIIPGGAFTDTECHVTLSRLSLVCRFFCAACVPRLFKVVQFNAKVRTKTAFEWARLFLKGEASALAVAPHVRNVDISHWAQYTSSTIHAIFLDRIYKTIHLLPALGTLCFFSTVISESVLETIAGIATLLSITFDECTWKIERELDIKRVDCRLTEVHIAASPWTQVPVEHAAALSRIVSAPALRTLHSSCWPWTRAIFEGFEDVELRLKELDIHVVFDELAIFYRILECSPAMQILGLLPFGWTSAQVPDFRLSPAALPVLHTVHAPSAMLRQVTRGRPVRDIGVYDAHVQIGSPSECLPPPAGLEDLRRSRVAITHLCVTTSVYMQAPVHELFPDLHDLFLRIEDDRLPQTTDLNKRMKTLLSKRSDLEHASLRNLRLRIDAELIWSLNLRMQRQAVDTVAKAFPSVEQCSFVDEIEWRRTNGALPEDGQARKWKLVVLDRARVKPGLRSCFDLSKVCDWEKSFAKLFEGERLPHCLQII